MKVDDTQLMCLSDKARTEGVRSGTLLKRSGDPRYSNRWQRRFCCVYRNLLFYYESDHSLKPNGVIFLEHCICLMVPTQDRKQYAFSVGFEGLGQRHFIFSTTTALERRVWMETIRSARMGNTVQECETLQKKVQLLQNELEKLQNELNTQMSTNPTSSPDSITSQELNQSTPPWNNDHPNAHRLVSEQLASANDTSASDKKKMGRRAISLPITIIAEAPSFEVVYELEKVKKLQGYFRGYLLRKKFRKLVLDYVNSPQADNRRQRNQITWSLLKSEDEYVKQLDVLVNQFQHPLELAATSRHPPLSLENCKAIFRNCEMLLMFHKILLQGFHQRTAKWPVVVISDLLEQMIPMMSCYSNYVQDHVHAIETFFEVSKEPNFRQFLSHLHSKPATKGLTLPELLAVPLDRVSVFMYSVQQLLAHTPAEHVEYNALKAVVKVLENMDRMVNEKASIADNIRQTLEFERKIVNGCPALLDEEQVLMREGTLKVRLFNVADSPTASLGKGRNSYQPRICILFSKHLLITCRQHNFVGFRSSETYRLLKAIPLADCSLQPGAYQDSSPLFTLVCSTEQQANLTVSMMEASMKKKAEWVADLSQCIANERHHKMLAHISVGKSLELDSSKIKFSPYKTGREQMVQSASLDSLLQRLITVGYSGMAFINTFLATYSLFTDAHTVMDFFVDSWHHCLKSPLIHHTQSTYSFTAGITPAREQQLNQSLPHSFASSGEKKASVVGILFVLKHWASKHYSDFEGDKELLKKLQSLISNAENYSSLIPTEQRALQDLKGCLQMQTEQTGETSYNIIDDMLKEQEKVELSPQWLLSFESTEVAKQLSLIEQSYYAGIEPVELITNAWSKKDNQKRAPNISQFFNNFNKTAFYFCWFVLNLSNPEERARGLEYLIEMAQHCLLLGNFSTFMQVMSAIEHTSISRLKKSWELISKHAKYQLQELKKLSSTDNKFKALRDATKRHSLPCVPYLGPMLNELCILFEVSPTFLESTEDNNHKIVNFNKMHKLNTIISNVMYYSQEQYDFEYNREILKSLLWVKEVDENILYTLSHKVEPKRRNVYK